MTSRINNTYDAFVAMHFGSKTKMAEELGVSRMTILNWKENRKMLLTKTPELLRLGVTMRELLYVVNNE